MLGIAWHCLALLGIAWHCLAATSSGANFKAMRDDPGKMPSRPDNSDSEQVQKSWACWFNKARVSCGSNIQTESPCFGSSTLPSTHTILHAINFFSLSTSQAVLPRESTDATVRWKKMPNEMARGTSCSCKARLLGILSTKQITQLLRPSALAKWPIALRSVHCATETTSSPGHSKHQELYSTTTLNYTT